MTLLEELIKQRDYLDEKIEELKQKQEIENLENLKSNYLNKIIRQSRKDFDDIIFIKVKSISNYDNDVCLIGDGVYLDSCNVLTKCNNESVELNPEYDTTIVTKNQMIEELNNIMYDYFG